MKVYIKVHVMGETETIACCDEDLLDQELKEGKLLIKISNQFFGGSLISLEDAISILKESPNFNIVGEKIIEKAINCNLLQRKGINLINGVPMALKMMF